MARAASFFAAVAIAAWVFVIAGPGGRAEAQDNTPPVFSAIDERGVDLLSGHFFASTPSIAIGQPGQGGLSYSATVRYWNRRDNFTGTIAGSGSSRTVSLGGSSETFTYSGGSWVSDQRRGSTLSFSSGVYTYTLRDGTVALFSQALAEYEAPQYGYPYTDALVTSVTAPTGEVLEYHYATVDVWDYTGGGMGDPEEHLYATLLRLQSVTNNLGYQIHFEYEDNGWTYFLPQDYQDWFLLVKVTAINNAVDYCNPLAAVCTSLTQNWPSLTFDGTPSTVLEVTDNLNRTTRYSFSSSRVTGIRPPGAGSDLVSISYDGNWRVNTVTIGGEDWEYDFSDGGGQRTVTITDPLNRESEFVSSLSTGLPLSATNGVDQTTSLQHDAYGRLTRVTFPEGNFIEFVYDARGNITETWRVSKPDPDYLPAHVGLLPDIITYASYPSTCSNPVTCNRPTSTTDAMGRVTDYAYNSTHGGVTSITYPAPGGSGDRPQTRFSYDQFYAWYKNSGGNVVQGPSAVWRPTAISACASGTAGNCVGTVNETVTEIGYGSGGAANNRLPVSTTVAAGNWSLSATTTRSWTPFGDMEWVDGPLSGSADRSYFFYNAARQPLGAIGPDPDGGGALLRRAVRFTYNSAGLPEAVERGTATGTSSSNLTGMTVLERQETDFDSLGRPVASRLKSGSTILALVQMSYNAAGQADCTAVRMNPSTFASPPSSACTLASTGSFGPDRITRRQYDAAGRPWRVLNAYGTGEEGIDAEYSYWPNGSLATLHDGEGARMLYGVDAHDRRNFIVYTDPDDPAESNFDDFEAFQYDAAGRVTHARRRSGDWIINSYDHLGRLIERETPSPQVDTEYAYDLFGRLLEVTDGSQTLTYTYDALSRLTEAESSGLGDAIVSYEYDAAGRRTRMTWPDAFYVTYDYLVTGEVTHIRENGAGSGIGVLATYSYDNLGRRTALTRGNGVVTSYAYDAAGRLEELVQDVNGSANDLTLGFTYNPAGQIASRAASNTSYAHSFANLDHAFTLDALHQYLTGGAGSFDYDARGNLTSYGSRGYAYDFDNRLTQVTGVGNPVNLTYDPAGRLYQVSQSQGPATRRFLYDGANLIGEFNTSNNMVLRYVHGPGLDAPLVRWQGSTLTTRRWLIADERGSVIGETNDSGSLVQTNTYDEYGNPGSGNAGRFGYTGQMWIANAGVYHYRNRAYHPGLGRFLQTDPIGQAGGLNLYAYVGNDPINFTDPWGLSKTCTGSRIRRPADFDCSTIATGTCRGNCSGAFYGRGVGGGGDGGGRWIYTDIGVKTTGDPGVQGHDGRYRNLVWIPNYDYFIWDISSSVFQITTISNDLLWQQGVRSIELSAGRDKHIRMRHGHGGTAPSTFHPNVLQTNSSDLQTGYLVASLVNSDKPSFIYYAPWTPRVILVVTLAAPIGQSFGLDSYTATVVLGPSGNGVYSVITMYPGYPDGRD